MRYSILLCTALLASLCAAAQPSARIYRTETLPYDTRHDAEARDCAASGRRIDFRPQAQPTEGATIVGQRIEIPYVWTDGFIYLHLENPGSAYTLRVNGREAARVDDALTPAEFDITEYIRQGVNDFEIRFSDASDRLGYAAPAPRTPFEGSYLHYRNGRSIRDFEMALVPDTLGRDFAMLDLKIVVQNGFNYDETIEAGYDIYSPQGKLLDFDIRPVTVAGRSTDTIRFAPFIYHAYENKWEPGSKNPPLYKVMLFTRRDGVYKEYMPLRVGFGKTEWIDGQLVRFGKPIALDAVRCNAASDAATTAAQLRSLRKQGHRMVAPDYPQPEWFYDLCDELGLYVVDRANIHAPEHRTDRRVGGTPSNDPALVDRYLERVQAMYYRSRNHTCVAAYALGGEAGNGYCLYKAYQWLKSVERNRPILCVDADGEWNSDL